ncbi:cold shock domain-containing protein [Flammeovirgaceae bacterium SG7u.111]|nr:cold shock domain-containing protein [Flammeovirgaceae bacterium SG7u.132]WPO36957.1 cold shock domain-containing protein [Flammeovirgaceae bacterium SG7u.111]
MELTTKGTVKFFNESKGFGFIRIDNSTDELFFHISGMSSESLDADDRVSFETVQGKRGPQATNVKLIRN